MFTISLLESVFFIIHLNNCSCCGLLYSPLIDSCLKICFRPSYAMQAISPKTKTRRNLAVFEQSAKFRS